MRLIPPKLRKEMQDDPWYDRCCVTGKTRKETKIEWHHNLIFKGRQVNEKWCILPLSKEIHDIEKRTDVKDLLDWIMYNRTDEKTLKKYLITDGQKARVWVLNNWFGKFDEWDRHLNKIKK